MPDFLTITDLQLSTRIGVPEEERQTEQRLLVTIEMATDTKKVAQTDDVSHGIDYFAVAQDVKTLAKTERKTIEKLAEDIAAMILERHTPQSVTVTVKKFPIPGVKEVSIQITRNLQNP